MHWGFGVVTVAAMGDVCCLVGNGKVLSFLLLVLSSTWSSLAYGAILMGVLSSDPRNKNQRTHALRGAMRRPTHNNVW